MSGPASGATAPASLCLAPCKSDRSDGHSATNFEPAIVNSTVALPSTTGSSGLYTPPGLQLQSITPDLEVFPTYHQDPTDSVLTIELPSVTSDLEIFPTFHPDPTDSRLTVQSPSATSDLETFPTFYSDPTESFSSASSGSTASLNISSPATSCTKSNNYTTSSVMRKVRLVNLSRSVDPSILLTHIVLFWLCCAVTLLTWLSHSAPSWRPDHTVVFLCSDGIACIVPNWMVHRLLGSTVLQHKHLGACDVPSP